MRNPFNRGYNLKPLPEEILAELRRSPAYSSIDGKKLLYKKESGAPKEFSFYICGEDDPERMLVDGRKTKKEGYVISFHTSGNTRDLMPQKRRN